MKDQLLACLKEELTAMKALLNILEVQYELLVSQDVFKLEAITIDIEAHSRDLAKCETNRRSLVGKASMQKVIAEIGSGELEDVYAQVTKTLYGLQLQKESNEILIRQSLGYTNAMLAMVGPKTENVMYNGYGKVGK